MEIPLNKTHIFFLNCSSFLLVVVGMFALAEGIFISDNGIFLITISIVFILFFGLKGIYGIRKMFNKSAGLIIDENGITDNSTVISAGLIKWADITEIKMKRNKLLIYTKNPGQYIGRKKGIEKMFMKLILFPLKNYVVLNYCHTALDAVSPEIKRDTASSTV